MRVLAVIDSLDQGGAERSLIDTLAAMQGVQVHLGLLRRSDRGFESDARAADFELHTVVGGLPQRVIQLRRLIGEVQPNVVHASLWNSDLAARLACMGLRVPLVSSLVNESYGARRLSGYPWLRRAHVRLLQTVDRATARRVDRFHAITQSVADHYTEHLGLDRDHIDVAWRGRDAAAFRPPAPDERARARTELDLEGTVLLAVARLEPQKRLDVLVDAMPMILRDVPDAHCVIVGRGGTAGEDICRRIEGLGLGDRVRCTGFRKDVPTFLMAADRFILPSAYEGLGGAVIEAMLAGLPVIASDLPGVREVTQEGALARLVPPSDATQLAAAVVADLADADGAVARSRRARAHAEGSLSLSAAASGLRQVYDRAIAG